MTRLSLVVVNYRSAAYTARAIATARSSSADVEVVVVDNSLDQREVETLERMAIDRLVISPRNGGYAGGLNAGVAASSGDVLILSNPDVLFHEQALDALVAACEDGAIAGPRFVWDDGARIMLPGAELPRRWRKRLEIAALRSPELSRLLDLHRFRARLRLWEEAGTVAVDALSGAVMAMTRSTFDRLGGFDEGFALYFEEIDLMQRSHRAGIPLRYVAPAICRHIYNQSASLDPAAGERYLASESRYYAKWLGSDLAEEMRRAPAPPPAEEMTSREVIELAGDPREFVVELSPLAHFATAAGILPADQRVEVPGEVLASLRDAPLYVRVVRRSTGEVTAAFRLTPHGKMKR